MGAPGRGKQRFSRFREKRRPWSPSPANDDKCKGSPRHVRAHTHAMRYGWLLLPLSALVAVQQWPLYSAACSLACGIDWHKWNPPVWYVVCGVYSAGWRLQFRYCWLTYTRTIDGPLLYYVSSVLASGSVDLGVLTQTTCVNWRFLLSLILIPGMTSTRTRPLVVHSTKQSK